MSSAAHRRAANLRTRIALLRGDIARLELALRRPRCVYCGTRIHGSGTITCIDHHALLDLDSHYDGGVPSTSMPSVSPKLEETVSAKGKANC